MLCWQDMKEDVNAASRTGRGLLILPSSTLLTGAWVTMLMNFIHNHVGNKKD